MSVPTSCMVAAAGSASSAKNLPPLQLEAGVACTAVDKSESPSTCLPAELATAWLLQRAPKHYSILTTPDPEEWRRVRKTISEAFSPAAIRKVRGCRWGGLSYDISHGHSSHTHALHSPIAAIRAVAICRGRPGFLLAVHRLHAGQQQTVARRRAAGHVGRAEAPLWD